MNTTQVLSEIVATRGAHTDPTRRHDFVFLFDVMDGNPNGDPDAGNLPRVDPETMHGLVTDVCVKRKVRDWVDVTLGEQARFKIYVQNKGIALNELHRRGYEQLGIKSDKPSSSEVERVREWMCANFYDVRTFGAVMTTKVDAGQVRGPLQLTFSRSVDPITPLDLAITRVAITKEGEDKNTEIGRKTLVPYALYVGHGFFTPHFALRTNFSAEDLAIFWMALQQAWELDRSASRGLMSLRGLYVFTHERALGDAPAHQLFDLIQPQLRTGITSPRRFADYALTVDTVNLPAGVTLTRLVG